MCQPASTGRSEPLFNFLKDLVWKTGKKFGDDGCPQLAAAITYYMIFSLFPFLIFLTGVVGLILDSEAQAKVVDEVLNNFPLSEEEGRDEVTEAITAISGTNAKALGLIGLGGLLWASSSIFNSLRRALNIVYRDVEYKRPWVQQKAVDLALVLGLGLFFIASIAATTALHIIKGRSEELAWLGDFSEDFGDLWLIPQYMIPFVFSFMAFTFCYTIVPSRNRNLGNAWPGALVAAVLFELAKAGFAWYVSNFKDYSVVFGSLGAVVSFMFWVYLSSQILLVGAEITTVYAQIKVRGVKQGKFPGFGLPLYVQAWRTFRSLFVRPPEKPTEP